MELVVWESPLHLCKAAVLRSVVPVRVRVVGGFGEFRELGGFEDVLLAVPGFCPGEFSWSWEVVGRPVVVDWTVSTFVVAGYRYPPRGVEEPGVDFEVSPARAVVEQLAYSLGHRMVVRLPGHAYRILGAMEEVEEAVRLVGTVLEEVGDPGLAVVELSRGVPEELLSLERAWEALEEYLSVEFVELSEEDLQAYADEVTRGGGCEVVAGPVTIDLVRDKPSKSSPLDREEAYVGGDSSRPVTEDRPELELDHVDWDSFYWLDHLTGAREPR